MKNNYLYHKIDGKNNITVLLYMQGEDDAHSYFCVWNDTISEKDKEMLNTPEGINIFLEENATMGSSYCGDWRKVKKEFTKEEQALIQQRLKELCKSAE